MNEALPELSDSESSNRSVEREEEYKDSREEAEVNVAILEPARALFIAVKTHGVKLTALVDTGASNSFIRESVWKRMEQGKDENTEQIKGLGDGTFQVQGYCMLDICLYQKTFKQKFGVCIDEGINYDMVIGKDFLKENKVIINMSKQKIGWKEKDGACVDLFLNEKGKILKVKYENVPVYSKGKIQGGIEKIVKVPIEVHSARGVFETKDEMIYLEGTQHDNLNVLSGVMEAEEKNAYVLVNFMEKCKKRSIRAGEELGRMSTMLSVEMDEEPKEEDEAWTIERMRQ